MKIKRFLAPDMRTALQHVRQEHGPDAVILSNRVIPEGVEIVAASQYDEELVRDAAETSLTTMPASPSSALPDNAQGSTDGHWSAPSTDEDGPPATSPALATLLTSTPEPVAAPPPPPMPTVSAEPVKESPMPTPSFPVAAEPTPVVDIAPMLNEVVEPAPVTPTVEMAAAMDTASAPAGSDNAISTQLREEFARMRQLIERGLNRMTDERLRCSPVRQQLMAWMEGQGFTDDIVRDVALGVAVDCPLQRIQAQALTLLGERLPISPANLLDEGGVMALIGPSGAGKTSTVGKLAAHYSTRYGVREIALISLDHARPGGSDRLYCLARQLGIAAHEADSAQALVSLLQRLRDYRVILIDSPGVTPRHPQSAEQLSWLRQADVSSLLVLPANTHHADLDDMVHRFLPAEPEGVIVTRLDETRRPGGVLSVVSAHQLPLTWVSDGQHLHDDLHQAEVASLLQRLNPLDCEVPTTYDPVAALVAKHAFA